MNLNTALELHSRNLERQRQSPWGTLRTTVTLPSGRKLSLPSWLASDGDVLELANEADRGDPGARQAWRQLLAFSDVEAYCRLCVTIRDKRGRQRRLIPNRPQQRFLATLERMRLAGKPLRVVLLKARQWGGSTITQAYCSWLQTQRMRGSHLAVVAYTATQARWIRGMHTLIIRQYPEDIARLTIRQYERDPNLHYIPERDCIIGVGSVHKPDAVRSFTFRFLHLSEVGLWPEKITVSGSALAQALIGTVPQEEMTLVVLESTARGGGTYFHEQWQRATRGESGYVPIFVPWWEVEEYAFTLDRDELEHVARTLDAQEEQLLHLGATLNHIVWRRAKKAEMSREIDFAHEYPATPEEAFASSGRPVFDIFAVQMQREHIREPERGFLRARGIKGADALKDVRLEIHPEGELWVWRRPGDRLGGLLKPGEQVAHRYAIFVDPGGRTDDADWWVATVVDRAWLLFDAPVEVVARWRAHTRPDLGAWTAAQLGRWYQNALLAIEVNRFRHRPDWEPEWSLAVLDEIRDHYSNLYIRQDLEKAGVPLLQRIGFLTTRHTKAQLISTLMRHLEEGTFVEHDSRALDEMLAYEYQGHGEMGAPPGLHDDIVISTAGALWLSDHMPPPVLTSESSGKQAVLASPFAVR